MTIPVSVIMPAYNSSSFIEATLRCVVTQSLQGFELIVVDDGSTDGTPEIAERFLSRHGGGISHRVIRSEENRGVSHARNVGIREARGRYLFFLDSDDRMEPDGLDILYNAAVRHGSDMAACRYDIVELKGGKPREVRKHLGYPDPVKRVLTGREALSLYLVGKLGLWMGNILYASRRIRENDIRFTEGMRYLEDREFIVKNLFESDYLVYVPQTFCHYVQHADSAMGSNETDIGFFLNPDWYVRVEAFLHARHASRDLMDNHRRNAVPRGISWRRSRLTVKQPFFKEVEAYLCRMARAYPYKMDGWTLRDAYYWLDNRIIAYTPSLYEAWRRIYKSAANLIFR